MSQLARLTRWRWYVLDTGPPRAWEFAESRDWVDWLGYGPHAPFGRRLELCTPRGYVLFGHD